MTKKTALIFASAPILAIGVWGAWLLLRTTLLEAGLSKGLFRLNQWGIVTEAAPLEWEGLGTAKLDFIRGSFCAKRVLEMQDVKLHIRPAISLQGREWVEQVEVSRMTVNWNSLHLEGRATFLPATLAGAWEGAVRLGARNECAPAATAHVRLAMGVQTQARGKRRWTMAVKASECRAFHPALGDSTKEIGELSAWVKVEAGRGRLALLPGSRLGWGSADLQATGHWNADAHTFSVAAAVPAQDVQDLVDPVAGFAPDWLAGLQAKGQVEGHFSLAGNLDSLEGLQLDGQLTGRGIAVQHYGPVDLNELTALAANPTLVPIDALPPYLVQAVLLSEDADFWEHRGFDKEIIRFAMIENLQEGRFVRGAGTIPMQLIRNVFLHHGKQADRKLAEVVLTWLAEEQEVLTKEEELMVYLNLIEWGDSIHGIREAAHHYFHKTPSQLTVDESIFLACIIPNPHHAQELLEQDGSLTPYAQEYFDSMRWMLYEGDWIGEEGLDAEYPSFRFARKRML